MDGNKLSRWSETGKGLSRRFEFSDFTGALVFVNKVGELAEAQQHHPDICLGWGYAELTLYTHSESAITQKDYQMARSIDELENVN